LIEVRFMHLIYGLIYGSEWYCGLFFRECLYVPAPDLKGHWSHHRAWWWNNKVILSQSLISHEKLEPYIFSLPQLTVHMPYSRELEEEADLVGLQLAAKVGILCLYYHCSYD